MDDAYSTFLSDDVSSQIALSAYRNTLFLDTIVVSIFKIDYVQPLNDSTTLEVGTMPTSR
jgi:hypothetical protein